MSSMSCAAKRKSAVSFMGLLRSTVPLIVNGLPPVV